MAPGPERLLRTKPYKAAAPADTVTAIRSRLESLGLSFEEENLRGQEGSFSCCLRLLGEVRVEPFFQTMGKGRTEAYARASAYGEMVERLQNLAFYMMLVYSSEPEIGDDPGSPSFKYSPDERRLEGRELRRGIGRLSRNGPRRSGLLRAEAAIGAPFWNLFAARLEHLPVRAFQVIVGSNGMCSGNTPAEALIHGICEVFERHVLKGLFLSQACPPDVPLEIFAGYNIHEDLCRLAGEHGWEICVKDCSLGLRLPVVGLLIRDGDERYALHLGSDPSPVTALERCFTEMCQGGRILFKNLEELERAAGDVRTSAFWRTQLHLNIRSYEGHWPAAVLRREPDRKFEGFGHPESASDEEDLAYVLTIVEDAGWELLIRDNSFLGLPSYHVYVPGISEMTNALGDEFATEYLAFDRHVNVVTNAPGTPLAQRVEAARSMDRYAAVAPSGQFCASDYLMYFRRHPLAGMSRVTLQEYLLQPALPGRGPDAPPCFECATCGSAALCNYGFVSTVWSRLKLAMAENVLTQDGLRDLCGRPRG